MTNKDGAAAVVSYVAAGGPVVREISRVFDHFWNGIWAVPIAVLVDRPYTEDDLQAAVKKVREQIIISRTFCCYMIVYN